MKYKRYQNELWLNVVYSRDNSSNKIKNGSYVINPDGYSDIGTYWIDLYALNDNVTYFNSFTIEYLQKETKTFNNNKNIKANIFRIQA